MMRGQVNVVQWWNDGWEGKPEGARKHDRYRIIPFNTNYTLSNQGFNPWE
jgi:hypothetical protein